MPKIIRKKSQTEAISKYSANVLYDSANNSENSDDSIAPEQMFSKMTYTINNMEESGDAATADITITNIDMQTIMGQYFAYLLENMFNQEITEEHKKIS